MAKYVVLAFESDDEADKFVDSVAHHEVTFATAPSKIDPTDFQILTTTANVYVRGVYKMPTLFCPGCAFTGKAAFTRGPKYGWWVCVKCGRPTKAWAQGDHWYSALGKNLLPPSALAPEWRGEGIAGHRFDEPTKQWLHVETGEPFDPEKVIKAQKHYPPFTRR